MPMVGIFFCDIFALFARLGGLRGVSLQLVGQPTRRL
jgi:hypothetical protein